ncbi:MAG: DUF2809 domain-containing protein [Nitrospinae bacterium]|nr:DUF2809 domain-containing protein [Nitrospinota bacterium]
MLAVALVGIASRSEASGIPGFVVAYVGDTVWALFVFLAIGFIMPRWPVVRIAALALAFSVTIEFSQLYQAPWINAIRENPVGNLAIGDGFLWSDLVCYAVGITGGVFAEVLFRGPTVAEKTNTKPSRWYPL